MTVFLGTLFVVAAAALLGSGQGRKLWRTVRPHRRRRAGTYKGWKIDLDQMPGHLERVQEIGDPAADEAFDDIAEQLLDDDREPRLAEVAERVGWLR
jgi:hypothetical protein